MILFPQINLNYTYIKVHILGFYPQHSHALITNGYSSLYTWLPLIYVRNPLRGIQQRFEV